MSHLLHTKWDHIIKEKTQSNLINQTDSGSDHEIFMTACDEYTYLLKEPEFPTCPEGYYLIDTFEDRLRATTAPNSLSYSFQLYCDVDLIVDGFAQEGHPENPNCTFTGSSEDQCAEYQDNENFEVDLDGSVFGEYTDNDRAGGIENAWFIAGPWTTTDALEGVHDLTFTHSEDGTTGVQSVAYKVTFVHSA